MYNKIKLMEYRNIYTFSLKKNLKKKKEKRKHRFFIELNI